MIELLAITVMAAVSGAMVAWIPPLLLRIWGAAPLTRRRAFYTSWLLAGIAVWVHMASQP